MNLRIFLRLTILLLLCCLSACRTTNELTEGQLLLKRENIVCDDKSADISLLSSYISQDGKRRVEIDGKSKRRRIVFDTISCQKKCEVLTSAMRNNGYLHASTSYDTIRNKGHIIVNYHVNPSKPYFIRSVEINILDEGIERFLKSRQYTTANFKEGTKYSYDNLEQERKHVTSLLRDNGYFKFNKDFIHFIADTLSNSQMIDLTMIVDKDYSQIDESPEPHKLYTIGKITYNYVGNEVSHIRPKVIESNMMLKENQLFSARKLSQTFNNYARLNAIKYSNIRFNERDNAVLDVNVDISTNKTNTISFQPEGTNTAGNLGAAASLTYENRNLFRGSETLTMQLRGAFEAITGLEGYQNKDYEEYNLETRLKFPRLIVPFISLRNPLHTTATTELAISFNFQNRPEFHRRVLAAVWRYRWLSPESKYSYKVDLLDINFISMPWMANTFRENYLDNAHNRNVILRYNYENLLIMKTGFGLSWNSSKQAMRVNFETSGNLLNLSSTIFNRQKNNSDQYTLFNIAYAQYVKGDVDYSLSFQLRKKSSLVFHTAFGIAYPYGNSRVLPFEKRYFSGGANSVRGWNVRGLGPGRYRSKDGAIDFINQTGDMKLDVNLEYRFPLFWKFNGAAFIDAGNIWTLRDYAEQEGGKLRIGNILSDLAVAYGIGLRLNFDYFILRFDLGMKAINPSYQTSKEHFPIVHPDFSRDNAFHFAVGLPF